VPLPIFMKFSVRSRRGPRAFVAADARIESTTDRRCLPMHLSWSGTGVPKSVAQFTGPA
jgi:hypothetical protein